MQRPRHPGLMFMLCKMQFHIFNLQINKKECEICIWLWTSTFYDHSVSFIVSFCLSHKLWSSHNRLFSVTQNLRLLWFSCIFWDFMKTNNFNFSFFFFLNSKRHGVNAKNKKKWSKTRSNPLSTSSSSNNSTIRHSNSSRQICWRCLHRAKHMCSPHMSLTRTKFSLSH